MLLALLPGQAPFRVDQVMAAPGLMAALFGLQVLLAGALSWTGSRRAWLRWWLAAAALLVVTALFFGLGSWGTSDVTKLSVWLAVAPGRGTDGEPFWHLVGPLISQLPYRMAAVHGLVAAGYGLAAILLARHWQLPAWAGWWCLFLTASPMLRGFLQNGQSRQALAVLLLLPLMLRAARLVRVPWGLVGGATAWSALSHTTFPVNLLFALLPGLVSANGQARAAAGPRRRWAWLVLAALAAVPALVLLGPVALQKLNTYASQMSFFSHYAVRREVLLLQGAMALAVVLACRQRGLGLRELLSCPRSRVLGLFALLYLALQASVEWEWWPQITFRLADGVGLFLLISFLAWLRHYRAERLLLPALAVTLLYWLLGRILPSGEFRCGYDDEFLCIPDRWPGLVRY
ncbi:hypothetical protein KBZ20_09765 [Vulcanococcus limneticus Candia 3F8]|uniref:hypothetical protein n=1 Tax=Vulcanococcus limneticus TaxID=2170428 RepID=UPI000B9841CD|nr:hypothetical protein [Vulcanococcus limneticus]MCP9792367.1 hypothetical protein [Vulcanococcus limneticus MW73D5]MCP9894057.1 hypothetical protein [Vulcanococcus limneticus Candia 3F8]MCP9897761.1 hypothetical protein [Vulcanococcus limneticus Candia 3B3]